MDRPVVSFCIATFQRYEILNELIQEILSVSSDKIEVVVSDDKSLDDSIEKIRKIEDSRLKIYVNEENVGSSLNIHDSLDRGNGRYLFYINDRDNVDKFKIEKLITILEELEKEDVAFAKCISAGKGYVEKYRIASEGKEALLLFGCRIDHPTGYIFKRDTWKQIKNRRILFENQKYGDFPITQICAIMAKNKKGALIFGDICDVRRYRINFCEVKSGYYNKRKDKRLWYTPEVIFRELVIGQKFLKKLGIPEDIREQLLIRRYTEYIPWCVTNYKDKIADPSCTAHNDFYPSQDFFHVFTNSILNGVKLWSRTVFMCTAGSKQVRSQINQVSRQEYTKYFKQVLNDDFHMNGKLRKECAEKDYEISRREEVLNTYESWMDAGIDNIKISDYLFANGYRHVAIYGMGRIGRALLKELCNSNIEVAYIIDRKLSKESQYYENVPCFGMEAELPRTDMIIVTVSGETEEIIKELRSKVKWEVREINDILFVV